jgi:hypothetical protein
MALLAGCGSPVATRIVYDDDLVVPAGLNGYVDLVLDDGQTAGWTWSSDLPVLHAWQTTCGPGGGSDGQPASSGNDSFTATRHGCKLSIRWHYPTVETTVSVLITGDGSGVTDGIEDGAH